MLIENIDKIIKLMEDTNEQGKIIRKYNHLKNIYDELEKAEAYIMQPNISLSNIKNYLSDIELFDIRNQILYLIGSLKKLNEEADTIENLNTNDIKILKTLAEELDEKVKINWQLYMKEKNGDVLDSLILLEKLVEDKVQVLQLKTMINSVGKNWPVTKDHMDKYKVAINDSTQLIDDLNVTENIKNFLLLVTKGEATLEDIDDKIYEWLRKNKLIGKMKIQPI